MAEKMNLILAVPPESFENASLHGFTAAYMAYKINHSPYLYRAEAADDIHGGIMAIDAREFVPSPAEGEIAAEIINECKLKGFTGIFLDTDKTESLRSASFCRRLGVAAEKHGLKLFLPAASAANAESAVVLIETAISGGTLTEHLKDAVSCYGASRLALDIERVRMDFTLPSYDGNGKALTAKELSDLYRRRNSPSFFSKELCANYFTYRQGDMAHFVLYDNAMSIKRKLMLAEKLGIKTAFLFYPEVADIINEIRGK